MLDKSIVRHATTSITTSISPLPATVPQLTKLAGFERTEVFRSGQSIYSQDDPAAFVYLIKVGMVRTVVLAPDGKRAVRGFLVRGEIFGMESSTMYPCSAEAVCDSYLVRFQRSRLEELAVTDNAVSREVLSWLLRNGDCIAQRLVLLGRGNAIEKLSYFLVDLADRLAVSRRLELPMSRTDIGDYLGLSSETVSRTFTTLREQGLIALDGRFVLFLDFKALRKMKGS